MEHKTEDTVKAIPLAEIPHRHLVEYSALYDVSYCSECDVWLEWQCSCDTAECPYSVKSVGEMPARPSMVNENA